MYVLKRRNAAGALAVLACLLGVTSQAVALEPNSFRLRGLGTGLSWVVEDPLSDMFRNPANLFGLEGLGIYTNLSNMQDQGNESFLSGTSPRRINLLGSLLLGATYVPEEWPVSGGLFVEYQDVSVVGDISSFKQDTAAGGSAFYVENEREFDELAAEFIDVAVVLPLALRLSRQLALGLKLSYEEFGGTFTLRDRKVEEQHVEIQNGDWTRRSETVSSDSYELAGNRALGALAGLTWQGDSVAAEVIAGYAPVRIPVSLADVDSLLGGTVMGLSFSNMAQFVDPGGLDFYASAWQIDAKCRASVGSSLALHGRAGFRVIEAGGTFSQQSEDLFRIDRVPEGFSHRRVSTQVDEHELKALITDVPVTLGLTWKFKDWGLFALGVNGHLFRIDADYLQHPTIHRTTYSFVNQPFDHTYIAEEFSTNNDYTRMSGDLWLGVLSFPVGVEMNLADWLAVRMGAETLLPIYGSGDVDMVEVDEPGYAETILSDGTSAQVDEDAEVVRVESELTSDELRSGITIYSAGLGFKVNDNITVDALSFANLTNLAYWKLSLAFSVTM